MRASVGICGSLQIAFYLLVQLGKTALHEATIKGNTEMVAYMMEHVNPNVDARDVVSTSLSTATCPIQSVLMYNVRLISGVKQVVGSSEARSQQSLCQKAS